MLTIEKTSRFKRDYKRESKGQHAKTFDKELVTVLKALANNQPLEPKYRDHPLVGEWADCRDCHIKPDLVLIYRKTEKALQLLRLGSHSELGL